MDKIFNGISTNDSFRVPEDFIKEHKCVLKDWLFILFQNTKIEQQKTFDEYKVDFYFPDLSIIVEYVEHEYENKNKADLIKEEKIKQIIWDEILEENTHLIPKDKNEYIKFVRIKQGKEIVGIRELLFTIEELTWHSPIQFM